MIYCRVVRSSAYSSHDTSLLHRGELDRMSNRVAEDDQRK
jgi:hypothetical protein